MNIINIQDKNLFFIGGVVRDELLNKKSFDIDITYVGDAIKFAQSIDNAEILQINEPFGTVRIKLNDKEIDIASTRNEIYPNKGHLPVVENIGCSLKEDVMRRDFTINALAKSTLTGEIIDLVDGIKDLNNKTLRILHDKSFVDDPTRIVRGLKFSVRFGFELDPHTKKLQNDYLNNINYDMSYKRLKKELMETFNLNSQLAFEKFVNDKIYKILAPQKFELPTINLEDWINKYSPKNIWIIYAGLFEGIEKLPLTKIEKNIINDYQNLQKSCQNFEDNDYKIYKTFEGANLESIIMFATKNPKMATKYLENLRKIKLKITGEDLRKLGIKPSPKYQQCFDYILKEKLKNPSISKTEEITLAKEFFKL
ncbi:MAG: CCA tRNA nucleotidyltransferase [Cyanobacteria bacterium SIG26]|nr:CCA tRNA nucleotidyltransferase [Cyanobacteria bacterium SIG26]